MIMRTIGNIGDLRFMKNIQAAWIIGNIRETWSMETTGKRRDKLRDFVRRRGVENGVGSSVPGAESARMQHGVNTP